MLVRLKKLKATPFACVEANIDANKRQRDIILNIMISLAIWRIQRKWHIQIDLHKRKDNSAIVTQQWTASNISQEIHSYFPRMTISNWLGNSLSSFFSVNIQLGCLESRYISLNDAACCRVAFLLRCHFDGICHKPDN